MSDLAQSEQARGYVGTLVGESTSQEFRLAVHAGAIREQDIIAVDADLERPDTKESEQVRVWAKVQKIERLNPLFPSEAGHELAQTRTNPLDTILSFSREMVTAVCKVLGYEPRDGSGKGRLDHLRYPAQPATSAYQPKTEDLGRIVLGEMDVNRGLDLASLSNRRDIGVMVDGHAVVMRHLAILAMTGAGKSWAARRLVEQLAAKNYPIVIFDPHGDYSGLAELDRLGQKVRRYYAEFPVYEQEPETVQTVVEALSRQLSGTQEERFAILFRAAKAIASGSGCELAAQGKWFSHYLDDDNIRTYGLKPNLFLMATLVDAVCKAGKEEDAAAAEQLIEWTGQKELRISKQVAGWIEGLAGRLRATAATIWRMEQVNRRVGSGADPLPAERTALVQYGQISIVSLAGYTSDFQATIYQIVARDVFGARVSGELKWPVLFVLEEAHNFAPAHAYTEAEKLAITTTKQIAQEGRKFGVGLVLISQRPSRLDETTVSQCNSQIVMRMINPADQNFVRRAVESLGDDDIRMLSGLDDGEAILAGQMINFPVLVKMKPPASKGERQEEDAFKVLERARQESRGEAR